MKEGEKRKEGKKKEGQERKEKEGGVDQLSTGPSLGLLAQTFLTLINATKADKTKVGLANLFFFSFKDDILQMQVNLTNTVCKIVNFKNNKHCLFGKSNKIILNTINRHDEFFFLEKTTKIKEGIVQKQQENLFKI